MRGRDALATAGGIAGATEKKKTGLVGPASSASSWMRLHHSAARLALRVLLCSSGESADRKIGRREETDKRLDACGVPCMLSFRVQMQAIAFIVL